MLKMNFNGEQYTVPYSSNEFSIGLFEEMNTILQDKKLGEYERYSKVFILLGIPEDVLDEFDAFAFKTLVEEFRGEGFKVTDFQKEIVINGRTYVGYIDEPKITVKDMNLIEKRLAVHQNKQISNLLAVIFKDDQLTKTEHYDKAHLDHKANIFRDEVTLDIAIPYITMFSQKLMKTFEAYKELEDDGIEDTN